MTVPVRYGRDRTRLTDHLAGAISAAAARVGRESRALPSVRVGSEDSLVGASGADRSRTLDVAQGHWPLPVGEHARHVVTGQLPRRCLARGDAPERAATQRLAADDGQGNG